MSQQYQGRRSRHSRAIRDPQQYTPYPGIPQYNNTQPMPGPTAQSYALQPYNQPQVIPQQQGAPVYPNQNHGQQTPVYPANQTVQEDAAAVTETAEAAAGGGILSSLTGLGGNLKELKGFIDRMGGIDGIMDGMGKVQRVVNGVQQMAPMFKLVTGLLPFGAAAAAKAAKDSASPPPPLYEEEYYTPRRRKKRKKSTSNSKGKNGSSKKSSSNSSGKKKSKAAQTKAYYPSAAKRG